MKGISGLNALNEVIYNKVATDEWLINKKVNTYQSVEKENAFPYVVLGESTATTQQGSTYFDEVQVLTFHVYSQSNSRFEAIEIMNRLLFLLSENFILSEWLVTDNKVYNQQIFEDIDEFTKHGVLQMRYKIKNKLTFRSEE